MNKSFFITEEHENRLPVIRIKKVVLQNFKSVEYGEITFNCGRTFIPYDTEPDIMGIYGQNGSGKTALIQALAILKQLMSGASVPEEYADCVSTGKEYAELEFTFDLQYPNEKVREAVYSFRLETIAIKVDPDDYYSSLCETADSFEGFAYSEKETHQVVVSNEKFSLSWEESSKRQLIIDTSASSGVFGPSTKRKALIGNAKDDMIALGVNKKLASQQAKSFVFLQETLSLLFERNKENIFIEVLAELSWFAKWELYVVTTRATGAASISRSIPIFIRNGFIRIVSFGTQVYVEEVLKEINKEIQSISTVLEQLVPGLSIKFIEINSYTSLGQEPSKEVMLVASRDGIEMPIRYESDGIKKIISVLALITAAFNGNSVTVAIDEFDAGIFEYLLGEILQAFEEEGKGQFIFTSHNLRPLEVIDKKYLYFTTTNPKNRYCRLKRIGATNNLRDTYFREIMLGEQKEKMYNRTKRFKIVKALKKARV